MPDSKPARSPALEARAERMRQQRRHVAAQLRQARYYARFPGAERAQEYIARYRDITRKHGHLSPNPDRAADCLRFAAKARALHADLLPGLSNAPDRAQAEEMLQALIDDAEQLEEMAKTASH